MNLVAERYLTASSISKGALIMSPFGRARELPAACVGHLALTAVLIHFAFTRYVRSARSRTNRLILRFHADHVRRNIFKLDGMRATRHARSGLRSLRDASGDAGNLRSDHDHPRSGGCAHDVPSAYSDSQAVGRRALSASRELENAGAGRRRRSEAVIARALVAAGLAAQAMLVAAPARLITCAASRDSISTRRARALGPWLPGGTCAVGARGSGAALLDRGVRGRALLASIRGLYRARGRAASRRARPLHEVVPRIVAAALLPRLRRSSSPRSPSGITACSRIGGRALTARL